LTVGHDPRRFSDVLEAVAFGKMDHDFFPSVFGVVKGAAG
jgi:hypothetical protein